MNKVCTHEHGWYAHVKIFWFFTKYIFICTDCGKTMPARNKYGGVIPKALRLTMKIDRSIKRIILNRIRTPDGTILTSHSVHDYREYEDANGKEYMVDGGHEYLRRTVHDDAPYEELSLYDDTPFNVLREALKWGTYGKQRDHPLTYVKLCDMSDDHIRAIIRKKQGADWFRDFMKKELIYRIENNIIVRDPDPASDGE